MSTSQVTLNGSSLTIEDLVRVARDPAAKVTCESAALERVAKCRQQIETVADAYARKWAAAKGKPNADQNLPQVYGVTTGFGEFKNIPIAPEDLVATQRNLLISHTAGVGVDTNDRNLANYFPADVVRAVFVQRINTFLRGNSGVRVETVRYVQAMLNGGIVPLVPLRGSVGSSGDLCPLAHLFGTLLGHGLYYVVRDVAEMKAGGCEIKGAGISLKSDLEPALAEAFGDADYQWPYGPSYKEALGLMNGATFSSAGLALGVHDAEMAATAADVAAAMSYEAVGARVRCLDPKVHAARGMAGQQTSAANLRALLKGSKVVDCAPDVQDVYSLRCAPQVHGASRDAIRYARAIAEHEINASTDNPLFFPDEDPWDLEFTANHNQDHRDRHAYSAGNFHGQPIGLAADFLAIAVAELANISERRTQMLLDKDHNRNLPANLIPNRGVNSGFMIAQYCAAGLVSENKVLAHPASVDSIPTSANSEDHVAMASVAANKLRTVISNTQAVLAIEMLCGVQAIDWRIGTNRPLTKSEESTEKPSPAAAAHASRKEADLFRESTTPEKRPAIAQKLGAGTRAAYVAVRELVPPMVEDRPLDDQIRAVWGAIHDGQFAHAVLG